MYTFGLFQRFSFQLLSLLPPPETAVSVFKYSNDLPSCKKSEKKDQFLRKCQTDRWTDRQSDRKTDTSDFMGSSVGWGFQTIQ